MSEIDWNREARRAVDKVSRRLSEAHRGAILWHPPTETVLAFDTRVVAPKQFKGALSRFAEAGIPIRASAEIEPGGCFVALLETPDIETVANELWQNYWTVKPPDANNGEFRVIFEAAQRDTATQRIERFMSGLENWWDLQQQ